ncbi:MAG: hypothetical protein Q7S82_02775, partial [bacterium]|nr:hypothetical protein [bacterium]
KGPWLPSRRKVYEFVDELQRDTGPVRQIGVRVWPSFFEKSWVLFGMKFRKPDINSTFTLSPVILSSLYDKVEVVVEYVDEGGKLIVIDPSNPQLERIRPSLERIIGDFYSRLQPQHA